MTRIDDKPKEVKKSNNIKDSNQKTKTENSNNNTDSHNTTVNSARNQNTIQATNNNSALDSFKALDNVINNPNNTNPFSETLNITANNAVTNSVNPQSGTDQATPPRMEGFDQMIPDSVKAEIGDVQDYLNNIQVPADITAQGADAVNKYKIDVLANDLKSRIREEDGSFKPAPPFDDVDAAQTVMASAALLSQQALQESGEFTMDAWKDKFVDYARAVGRFGDYGWSRNFQDGTPTQTGHFWMAFEGSYGLFRGMGNNFLTKALLNIGGAHGHEILADGGFVHLNTIDGRTKEDLNNSLFAVEMARQFENGDIPCPFSFTALWAQKTREGQDIPASAFYLPHADISYNDYPVFWSAGN
jgi:hypothetical protein